MHEYPHVRIFFRVRVIGAPNHTIGQVTDNVSYHLLIYLSILGLPAAPFESIRLRLLLILQYFKSA
jgi:hypothetical protein